LSYASWVNQIAWAEFSDIPQGYQGRARSSSPDNAAFDHDSRRSTECGKDEIHVNNTVRAGRNRDFLLSDRLEIYGLREHSAGHRNSGISPFNREGDRDRAVGGNVKGLHMRRNDRL
jgi:hypothetical protein